MASRLGDNDRPIIIRKVKKVSHGGHHGGAWKVAYADFVTAMMAFFMLLWLLANPDKERLRGLAEYFTPTEPATSPATTLTDTPGEAPGLGGRTRKAQSDSRTTVGQPSFEAGTAGSSRGGTAMVPDAALRILAQELKVALDATPSTDAAKENVAFQSSREGLRISLMDNEKRSMFRGSTAQLNDYALDILGQIVRTIAKSSVQVSIEGHTDNKGGQSEANWHLSGDRAQSARSAMLAAGLAPGRIGEVVAKAGTEPVYPDQPERPENRRITIVLMGEAPALPRDASFRF